ncbi:MAG TPA: hypothetical protein PLW55_04455, partial [Leptospiraceae bacterium]|nr:hypothetical protein [Leptospiraceae bacterium]
FPQEFTPQGTRFAAQLPAELALGRSPGSAPLLRGKETGDVTFFVCRNQACEAPVHSARAALDLAAEALALKRN